MLTLYDPDRSQTITQLGEIRPWNAVIAAVRGGLSAQSATKGAGLRILTETVNSPSLAAQIQQVLQLQPNAKWIQWEPMPRDNARAGARTAFGEYLEPVYDLSKADVILSLDADFLASEGAGNLRYARQFAGRRKVEESADNLNRLYVVESNHSVTGGRADNRLPLKSSQIEAFARAVAQHAGVAGITGTAPAGSEAFADAVAKDLAAHRGRAVVDGRRFAAARRARDCPRAERRHRRRRRHGVVPADAGSGADRAARRAARAGDRHRRRSRADAGDHRRIESRW